MLKLLLFLIAIALIIWWGYQYNRDLPQRAQNSARNNRFLQRLKRQNLAHQFQEWITLGSLYEQHPIYQGMPSEKQTAFADWLRELDEDAFKKLFAVTKQFSRDSQINLRWVLNGEANADSVLQEGAAASVVAYLIAYWEANELQTRAKVFQRYEQWQGNPGGRRNRAMTQALYNKLSTRRDVKSLPAELTLASQKKRVEYMVDAVQSVAERDIEATYSAIEEIQLENESPSLRTRLSNVTERFRRQPNEPVATIKVVEESEQTATSKGRGKAAAKPAAAVASA